MKKTTDTPKIYCSNLEDFVLGLRHHFHFYPHMGYELEQFKVDQTILLHNGETEEPFQIVNKLNFEEEFVLTLKHKERFK